MALSKLEQLKKLYGKTYASHAVEKIIEDTWSREIGLHGGNSVSNAAGVIAGNGSPDPISQLNDAAAMPRAVKTKAKL